MSDAKSTAFWVFIPDGDRPEVGESCVFDEAYIPVAAGLLDGVGIVESMDAAEGPIACRLRLSGDARESECTVDFVFDASTILRDFACWAAEQVVGMTGEGEPRCRRAINASRAWAAGAIDDAARRAAQDAARAVRPRIRRKGADDAIRACVEAAEADPVAAALNASEAAWAAWAAWRTLPDVRAAKDLPRIATTDREAELVARLMRGMQLH